MRKYVRVYMRGGGDSAKTTLFVGKSHKSFCFRIELATNPIRYTRQKERKRCYLISSFRILHRRTVFFLSLSQAFPVISVSTGFFFVLSHLKTL